MNLQSLKLKASTLCAGGTLLVFGGFLTVNLAGCGGGGGNGITTVPTPRPVGANFRIVQQDGTSPSKGGTVTLTGNGQTYTGTADNNGVVNLGNVPPGNYSVTFTATDNANQTLPATTRQLSITNSGAQNFVLVQGDTGKGAFTLSGTIFLNSPDGSPDSNCNASSTPYIGDALISVRDLNDTSGAPIIAQVVRPLQNSTASNLQGRYTISIPTRPRSFRVEVTPASNQGTRIAGIGATTTFTQGNTSLDNVNVCANQNGVIPVPKRTPLPTNTPGPRPTVPGTTTTGTTTTGTTTTGTTTTGTTTTGTTTNGTTTTGTTTNGTTTNGTTTNGTTTNGTTTTGTTTNGTTTTGTTTTGTTTNGTTTTGTTTNGTTTTGTTTTGTSSTPVPGVTPTNTPTGRTFGSTTGANTTRLSR